MHHASNFVSRVVVTTSSSHAYIRKAHIYFVAYQFINHFHFDLHIHFFSCYNILLRLVCFLINSFTTIASWWALNVSNMISIFVQSKIHSHSKKLSIWQRSIICPPSYSISLESDYWSHYYHLWVLSIPAWGIIHLFTPGSDIFPLIVISIVVF